MEDRIKILEDRLDRIAIRQCVSETMLATTVGLVLRTVGDDLRRQIMRELRKSVHAECDGQADPARAQMLILEMDEMNAQLLDQIERLSRA